MAGRKSNIDLERLAILWADREITVDRLTQIFNSNASSIRRACRRAGLPARTAHRHPPSLVPDQYPEFIRDWTSGVKQTSIMQKYGMRTRGTMIYWVRKLGMEPRLGVSRGGKERLRMLYDLEKKRKEMKVAKVHSCPNTDDQDRPCVAKHGRDACALNEHLQEICSGCQITTSELFKSLVEKYAELRALLNEGVFVGVATAKKKLEDRVRVVTLCGSTRFKSTFEEAMRTETLAGRIVLTVGMFGHQEGLDMNGPIKEKLDELHKRKIDRSDEILVLNVGGYIGSSTRSEIEYAKEHGKVIRYLEPVNEDA